MKKRGAGTYRYGFNGKENDKDVKGNGDQIDYGNRIYDPRLGRFLSVDPLQAKYPELTPYQFASNTPIEAIDLDGLEKFHFTLVRRDDGKPILKFDHVENFTETKTRWSPTLENPLSFTHYGHHDLIAFFHGRVGSTLPFFP